MKSNKNQNRFRRGFVQAQWLLAAVTLFYAAHKVVGFTLSALVAVPFELYRQFVEWIVSPLLPYIESTIGVVGAIVNLELHLAPNWKFLAVPLFLYFTRDFSELMGRGRWATAIGGGLVALLVLVLCSIDGSYSLVVQLGMPLVGLILYALAQTFLTSAVHGPAGQSFNQTLTYYTWNTLLPASSISFAAFLLGFFVSDSFQPVRADQAIAGTMLIYVVLMNLYWLAQAQVVARRDGHEIESLGAYKLAAGVFGTMGYVTIYLLINFVTDFAGPSG